MKAFLGMEERELLAFLGMEERELLLFLNVPKQWDQEQLEREAEEAVATATDAELPGLVALVAAVLRAAGRQMELRRKERRKDLD